MTTTAQQSPAPASDLANDPGATVTVSITGSDGVEVSISNANGQPLTAETVILAAARVLNLTAFRPDTVGVVVSGQPAELTTPVKPGDMVSTAPQVGNG